MPLTIPGVVRYAMNGTSLGRAIVNVLDYKVDTTGSSGPRDTAVFDIAGILINQWVADIMLSMSSIYVFNSVSWVDLNSAGGTTGARISTASNSLPKSPLASGETLPGSVTILHTKQTISGRGKRNGRMYLSPVLEQSSSGNSVPAASLDVFKTRATAFLNNTNQTNPVTQDYTSRMVVAHILSRDLQGNPLTGDSTDVTAFVPQALVASQRRRVRG